MIAQMLDTYHTFLTLRWEAELFWWTLQLIYETEKPKDGACVLVIMAHLEKVIMVVTLDLLVHTAHIWLLSSEFFQSHLAILGCYE